MKACAEFYLGQVQARASMVAGAKLVLLSVAQKLPGDALSSAQGALSITVWPTHLAPRGIPAASLQCYCPRGHTQLLCAPSPGSCAMPSKLIIIQTISSCRLSHGPILSPPPPSLRKPWCSSSAFTESPSYDTYAWNIEAIQIIPVFTDRKWKEGKPGHVLTTTEQVLQPCPSGLLWAV